MHGVKHLAAGTYNYKNNWTILLSISSKGSINDSLTPAVSMSAGVVFELLVDFERLFCYVIHHCNSNF